MDEDDDDDDDDDDEVEDGDDDEEEVGLSYLDKENLEVSLTLFLQAPDRLSNCFSRPQTGCLTLFLQAPDRLSNSVSPGPRPVV